MFLIVEPVAAKRQLHYFNGAPAREDGILRKIPFVPVETFRVEYFRLLR